jgi:hypothetical protein
MMRSTFTSRTCEVTRTTRCTPSPWSKDGPSSPLTSGIGLANPFRYPNGAGTVLVRLPNTTLASEIARRVGEALAGLDIDQIGGATVVIEVGRVRVRRNSP